ncbi:MAG: DinB family protein [Gemmatimonadaceae bacterium]|nr:DinB family protein [Gemmatimonadaceae bacterium]
MSNDLREYGGHSEWPGGAALSKHQMRRYAFGLEERSSDYTSAIKPMRHLRSLFIVLVATAAPAQGQGRDLAVSALSLEWRQISANILKAAVTTPDSLYGFRPVSTVWSFGELVHHVAQTQLATCASANGTSPATTPSVATDAPKAELVTFRQRSMEVCGPAYQQNLSTNSLGQGELTKRYGALVHNTAHINEHYGNMVTYLRIKGLVPPSSQR